MNIILNTTHEGIQKVWEWGGSNGQGFLQQNVSVLFFNGHLETFSYSGTENAHTKLVDDAEEYVRKLNDQNPELTDQELLAASEEDWAFYKKIADQLPSMAGKNNDGLDKFGKYIPYHSGPHILRHIKRVIEKVNPKQIFEIGFNMGHSSFMWLTLSDATVFSCDISEKDETIDAAALLKDKYPMRFGFEFRRNINEEKRFIHHFTNHFDLIFIDGGHEEEDVTEDIQLAKDLGIPYLLFDDIYRRFGPGVLPSIEKYDLELVEDMNNLRLYKWKQ